MSHYKTHGHTSHTYQQFSRAYRSWMAMKGRCLIKTNGSYPYYGAKGVTIHQPWIDSYEVFLADVGECPPGHSLGRTKNSIGYYPGNVRWETPVEQANNRSTTHFIVHNGISQSVTDWAKQLGIPRGTLSRRIISWPQSRWFEPARKKRVSI